MLGDFKALLWIVGVFFIKLWADLELMPSFLRDTENGTMLDLYNVIFHPLFTVVAFVSAIAFFIQKIIRKMC